MTRSTNVHPPRADAIDFAVGLRSAAEPDTEPRQTILERGRVTSDDTQLGVDPILRNLTGSGLAEVDGWESVRDILLRMKL